MSKSWMVLPLLALVLTLAEKGSAVEAGRLTAKAQADMLLKQANDLHAKAYYETQKLFRGYNEAWAASRARDWNTRKAETARACRGQYALVIGLYQQAEMAFRNAYVAYDRLEGSTRGTRDQHWGWSVGGSGKSSASGQLNYVTSSVSGLRTYAVQRGL